MSPEKDGSAFGSILAALGAGALFLLFWLVIGVPLIWSAGAGIAGYIALWLVGKGLGEHAAKLAEKPLDTNFVDKDLAKKTVLQGRTQAAKLRDLMIGLSKNHHLGGKFSTLANLIDAIASDVETDPKDAPLAFSFLAYQGEAVLRLLSLVIEIESRGIASEIKDKLDQRLANTLAQLEQSFRNHLLHLQEDNIAELQAELDVLEQSLGFDFELKEAVERESLKNTESVKRKEQKQAGST